MEIEKYVNDRWESVQVIIIKDDEDDEQFEARAISIYDKWRCKPEAATGIRLLNDANQTIRLCHA